MRGRKATIAIPRVSVGYARVSRREQATDGSSLTAQENRLRALASSQGRPLERMFIDPGFSGGSLKRPAVQELLASIERGEIDALYLTKLDRLCRSLADLLGIVRLCERKGVALISASEHIDTGSPAGRMMVSMLGAFAEFERERIAERIRDVAYDKRQQRRAYCRNTPFGYRRIGDDLVPDERDQTGLAKMRAMKEKGASLRQIGAWLSENGYQPRGSRWHAASVKAVLESRMNSTRLEA